MSLIPCPECNSEVSDRAKACPRCGFPIADSTEQSSRDFLGSDEAKRAVDWQELEPTSSSDEGVEGAIEEATVLVPDESTELAGEAGRSERAVEDQGQQPVRSERDTDWAWEYEGIGPWLRILCFFLIGQPVWEFLGLYGEMSQAELTDNLRTYVYSNYALAGVKFLIGISVFGELRKAKNWGTIKLTASLLWVAWPLATSLEYLVLPQIFLGDWIPFASGGLPVALGSVALSACFALAWTVFLLTSKRVAVTYKKARSPRSKKKKQEM